MAPTRCKRPARRSAGRQRQPAAPSGTSWTSLPGARQLPRYPALQQLLGLRPGDRAIVGKLPRQGQLAGSWPRGEQPLSRSERLELQERLVAQGFDTGTPDGIIGANTRKAIRGFQQQLGWPADGHPTQELLGRLRSVR